VDHYSRADDKRVGRFWALASHPPQWGVGPGANWSRNAQKQGLSLVWVQQLPREVSAACIFYTPPRVCLSEWKTIIPLARC